MRPRSGSGSGLGLHRRPATIMATLQRQTISLPAFIAAVQDAGTMTTAGEADRAARVALVTLGGCLSRGAIENLAGHLPKAMRQLVRDRSYDSSMCRFAPGVFLQRMADEVGMPRAAQDARAVLRTLDLILPDTLCEQLHTELASLWGPLTR
jgi:uncharacterized protein (DUF2267 family)